MPIKKTSRKSKSTGTTKLQILLWILFILSLGALVLTIVIQCQHSDSFTLNDTRDFLSEQPEQPEQLNKWVRGIPNDPLARAGNTDTCQGPSKFPSNVRDDYKMTKYYPVMPTMAPTCNLASNDWLENATTEDIQNLTVEREGKIYRCNKSSPPSIVASGLSDAGLSQGVM
jgi:hypothetical protein